MAENANSFEKIGYVTLDYTYYGGEDLYSEGLSEDRLLDFVMNHTESDYEEYIQISRSWSVMYHLSHIRQNVVSWLPIRSSQNVLEIGSGCGAITGAFCRVASQVTCVELSKKRSLINAYRNKEYDNLKIMVGNFQDIEPHIEDKYDYITLIGVLEYAQSYINSANPYEEFLNILKKHLKPGGKVVIAIENRLGLKYFAGCKEDHLGSYFAGITGYTKDNGVRTFSKHSLQALLDSVGYHYKFYYPYPDYKLPHTVYSDEKLPALGELDTNLRNFDNDRIVLFDEKKAFDSLIDEGLFAYYSNSYVVMASPEADWSEGIIMPIYCKYANERVDKFRVNTLIARGPSGDINVFKGALNTKANEHIRRLCDGHDRLIEQFADTGFVPVKCTFLKGTSRKSAIVGVADTAKDVAVFDFQRGLSLEDYLLKLEEEKEYEKMEEVISEYVRKLNNVNGIIPYKKTSYFDEMFGKRNFNKEYKATNPCNLDMIFSNIILDKDKLEGGSWNVLDYEWILDFPVPIQFVIYRAIFYHFRDREDMGFSVYLSKKGLDVYSFCGIDAAERMLFEEMEHAYQVYIIGGAASLDVMRVLMPSATISVDQLVRNSSYLKDLDTPKIYFSRTLNFTEENQITQIGKVDEGLVRFKVDFNKYLNSIRIDPTEYPCVLHISSIRYVLKDGTKQDVLEVMMNGYKISERTYLFNTNDPQIIIENVPAQAKSMEVSYNIGMIEPVFYEEIVKLLKDIDYKEQLKKRELKYRIKRKLKIIREDAVLEGYRRVLLSDNSSYEGR